jgi:hypothetical protein
MGFNFRHFISQTGHNLNRFRNAIRSTYHTIKSHARKYIPIVKDIARRVKEGAQQYSSLPVVGNVASQIGQGASLIEQGANWGQRILDASDTFDRSLRSGITLRGNS